MTQPTVTSTRTYWPALDGIRGMAILLVVLGHTELLPDSGGAAAAGVAVFFTLSGFLITNVLLNLEGSRRTRVIAFYGARAARLFPAMVMMTVAVGVIWVIQGHHQFLQFGGYAITSMLYMENLFHGAHGTGALDHTWSLAVEEQFYLIWPLLLPLAMRGSIRRRLIVLLAASGCSVLLRLGLLLLGASEQAYVSLPTNAYALLAGCGLAIVAVPRIGSRIAAVAGVLVLAVAVGLGSVLPGSPYFVPVLATVAALLLITAGLQGNPVLAFPPLRFIGIVSYSWYLWHWPLLWMFDGVNRAWPGVPLALIALVIASASTYFVEKPIRRRWSAYMARRKSVTRPEAVTPKA